eukprot:TRINITY_DN5494_c0_g1_i1.p1 TRINITY_DN5494_c0_g1~~TRINITY_DN5494_c0_g1_i1.p1  ORF type:complete len:290 (+),score=53.09 TRINITY_DN5494_c0_g1_i1:102-872(+)
MAVYSSVDTNGDGFLDKEELVAMLTNVGMSAEKASALFDLADHDKSGSIDFEEFCTWLFLDDVKDSMRPTVDQGNVRSWNLKELGVESGDLLCSAMFQEGFGQTYSYDVSISPPDLLVEVSQQFVEHETTDEAPVPGGSQVFKFQAVNNSEQVATAKVKIVQTEATAEASETKTMQFTINIEPFEKKKHKPTWQAFASTNWIKVDAKDSKKVRKKVGPKVFESLQWIPEVYEPKSKKLHVQATYCFVHFVDGDMDE